MFDLKVKLHFKIKCRPPSKFKKIKKIVKKYIYSNHGSRNAKTYEYP